MAVTATASDYNQIAQQLYIAYFGRPADYYGLQNMTAALAASGAPTDETAFAASYSTNATVKSIIDNFGNSAESTKLYGTGSDSSFVTAIFNNVLGRDPLLAGLNFWVNAIETGAMTRAQAAENILEGAVTNGTAADKATVAAKYTVASDFTNNIDTAAEVNAYSGANAANAARAMLLGVTSATDATTFPALASSTLASIVTNTVVSTQTLTTGVDTLVGTSGNDVFTATVTDGATAAVATLSTFDSINGGGGVNTLNIIDTAKNFGGPLVYGATGATITNIQTVNVSTVNNAGTVGTAFDVSGNGVTTLVVSSTGALGDVLVGDKTTNISDTTVGDSTITGAANVTVIAKGAVTIAGVTGAVSVADADTFAAVIGVSGGTTVNVTAAGNGDINIGAFGVLNTAGTALTSASAATLATGNITVNESTTASGVTTFGDGQATIFTNGATSVSLTGTFGSTITDVHTVVGSGGFGTSTLASVTLDGVLGGNTVNSDALTSLTILDNDNNIDLLNTATYTVVNANAHTLALTVGQNLATGDSSSPASSEFANVTDDTATAITLATVGAVSVSVELAGAKLATLTTTQTVATSLDLSVTDVALTTITDTGTGALTLTGTLALGADKLATIDAHTATGAVTVALADGTSFAGGTGNDVVTIDGAYAGTATGGAGTNTLVFNDTGDSWITYTTAGGGAAGVSGFSILGLTAAAGEGTYNIGGTSFNTVADLNTGISGITTIINGFSTTATVNDAASLNSDSFDIGYSANHGSLTVNVGADSAAADGAGSTNVEFGVSTHLTGAALAAATTAGGAINGVSTITVHSAGITDAQADGPHASNIVHLTDDALTSLVITGDSDVSLTYSSLSTGLTPTNISGLTSIDASASTGTVNLQEVAVSDFGGVSIKGGAGLLVALGGAGTDTITTGSGGGFIEGGQGADVINLTASAAVADFLFVREGDSQATGFDVVTGFTNFATKTTAGDLSDSLVFGDALGVQVTPTAITAQATATATGVTNLSYTVNTKGIITFGGTAAAGLTVTQAITDALAIADASGVDHFAAFQLGGNTYVLETGHSVAGATTDSVIELVGVTGLTGLSTTAFGAHTLHLGQPV